MKQSERNQYAREQTLKTVVSQAEKLATMENKMQNHTAYVQTMIEDAKFEAQTAKRKMAKELTKKECLVGEVTQLKNIISELEKSMEKRKSENELLISEYQANACRNEVQATKEIEQRNVEIRNLGIRLARAEENSEGRNKIKKLEAKIRDKDVMLLNRDVRIEELKKKQCDHDTVVEPDQDLQEEMNRLRDELYDMQNELESKQIHIAAKENELKQVMKEKETLEKSGPLQQLDKNKAATHDANKLKRLEQLNKQNQNKLAEICAQIDRVKAARGKVQARITQLLPEEYSTNDEEQAHKGRRKKHIFVQPNSQAPNYQSRPNRKNKSTSQLNPQALYPPYQGSGPDLESDPDTSQGKPPPSVLTSDPSDSVEKFPALGRDAKPPGQNSDNSTPSTRYADAARPTPVTIKIVKFGTRRGSQQPK